MTEEQPTAMDEPAKKPEPDDSGDNLAEEISNASSERDIEKFPMDLISDDDVDKDKDTLSAETAEHDVKANEKASPPLSPPPYEAEEESKGKTKSKKEKLQEGCYSLWRPCLVSEHPLPSEANRSQQLAHAFMCPPHGHLARWLTMGVTLLLFWGVVWSLTEDNALPGGNFFALIMLFVFCILGGIIAEKMHLPPLLGMLIMGCLLRNVPKVNVAKDIDTDWSGALRNIALVVILSRAGLGLDPVALR